MSFLDALFPGRAERLREESEARAHRSAMRRLREEQAQAIQAEQLRRERAMSEVLEREVEGMTDPIGWSAPNRKRGVLAESADYGPAWTDELAGLSLADAFKRGLPMADASVPGFLDTATVAGDDALRHGILRFCRGLYESHPHAKGIVETVVNFVVGPSAWSVDPSPKVPRPDEMNVQPVDEAEDPTDIQPVGDIPEVDPANLPDVDPERIVGDRPGADEDDEERVDAGMRRLLRRAWKKFVQPGVMHPQLSWSQFWKEAFRRSRRDGEVFIYLGGHKHNGRLAPRFIDPLDISRPIGKPMNVDFDPYQAGVQVDEDDPETVAGYWFQRHGCADKDHEFIPADKMIHIKFGVDANVRRGLPMLYVIRRYLFHFDRWIEQSLRHQRVQSAVAMVRNWENATKGQLEALRDEKKFRERRITTPAGTTLRRTETVPMPIIDAPAGMKLDMVSPNGNFSDSEVLVRRVMLACAVGANLSEAMVTADGSNANYASTRVTQFPAMRGFEADQGDWSNPVRRLYFVWCYRESALQRIPRIWDDCQTDCDVSPDELPNFEGEITAGFAVQLFTAGIISKRTAQEMSHVDPDIEKHRMKEEAESDQAVFPQLPIESDTEPELEAEPGVEPGDEDPEDVPPVEDEPDLDALEATLDGVIGGKGEAA